MKRLAIACLATLFACGSAWSMAGAQQYNGHHYGWRNDDRGRHMNQCGYGPYRPHPGQRRGDRDRDDDRGRNGNRPYGQYGQYGRNGQYGQYGQYGPNGSCAGQYGGQYGNAGDGQSGSISGQIVAVNGNEVTLQTGGYNNGGYGGYNNGGYGGYNNGGYGGYNNGGYGQRITINDQPALNNQTSGRVATGRYVTAYGYWRNGVFYATRLV